MTETRSFVISYLLLPMNVQKKPWKVFFWDTLDNPYTYFSPDFNQVLRRDHLLLQWSEIF